MYKIILFSIFSVVLTSTIHAFTQSAGGNISVQADMIIDATSDDANHATNDMKNKEYGKKASQRVKK